MSRRHRAEKREIIPDPKFGDAVLSKFMNSIMNDGKKSAAERIVYGALDRIEDKAKIIVIFLSCFAPLVISAQAGVKSVTIEQIHAAYSMGASRAQVIWNVVLKAAMPEILTGMRIAIAFGWTTLVAAELVAARAGLGVMVLNAARFLATDIVFLGIVIIGIIAFVFDLGMRWLERRLVPWKGKV